MVVAHNPENGETMTDYIAIASFPTTAQSYEAFSKLTAQADRLGIVSGAIVEVDDSGHVSIPEARDSAASFGFGTGSVIGLVIGALAGPIGMLLGWGVGALAGSTADLARADAHEFALSEVASRMVPGSNVVVLHTTEDNVELLNGEVARLGGAVIRRSLQETISEIEAEAAAIEAADEAARKALREQRREEVETAWKDRVADLKEKHETFVAGVKEKVSGFFHGDAK